MESKQEEEAQVCDICERGELAHRYHWLLRESRGISGRLLEGQVGPVFWARICLPLCGRDDMGKWWCLFLMRLEFT